MIDDVAAVEQEGGFDHGFVDFPVIQLPVGLPIRHDSQRVAAFRRPIGVFDIADLSFFMRQIGLGIGKRLGIGNDHFGMLRQQFSCDVDGRAFARVAGVGFEGKPQDADFFPGQRVEHGSQDIGDEPVLLVFIDFDDAFPVGGHFRQTVKTAQVHQVEDVFLEAGSAEADARLEKFGADAAVRAHGVRDFGDVGVRLFTKRRYGIDGGYPLRQKGVGHQFGKFGAPDVRGDDLFSRQPAGVNFHKRRAGGQAAFGFARTDQHPVGIFQIADGGSLRHEFRIGKDVKRDVFLSRRQDPFHRLRRFDRQRAFFNDDFRGF